MEQNKHQSIKDFLKQKDSLFNDFYSLLTVEYKTLKKITHQCQAQCFSDSSSTLKEAESCARTCMNPYLILRKATHSKLGNCDEQFKTKEQTCVQSEQYPGCYQKQLDELKECLKITSSLVKPLYNKGIKDFDQMKNEGI